MPQPCCFVVLYLATSDYGTVLEPFCFLAILFPFLLLQPCCFAAVLLLLAIFIYRIKLFLPQPCCFVATLFNSEKITEPQPCCFVATLIDNEKLRSCGFAFAAALLLYGYFFSGEKLQCRSLAALWLLYSTVKYYEAGALLLFGYFIYN